MGQEVSNEWSHGASNEPGSQQGAGNQQKARETAGSQHGARERAMESAMSQGAHKELGSQQWVREPWT